MANYYASARTNYFRVKDEATFTAWAKKLELAIVTSTEHPECFALYPTSGGESFPNYDPEKDEEFDFDAELAAHLTEDSIAIRIEVGAEKLRYLVGYAVAINAKGETESVSLDEIYELAKARFGSEPSRAEY